VLNRQYIRIHEVSREKDAGGGPAYEAWIYLVWDAKKREYAVMWLDNTAATNFAPEGVGHATPDGDRIPIVWNDADGGGIRTTFAFDRAKDVWSWTIDNVSKAGTASPFARVTLTRTPSPEAEVKAAVERFLAAAGRGDLDALPAMFAPGASIASAALRDGRWVTTSRSFEAWLAGLRAAPASAPYEEPVHEFTVHIDDGQLAFVRADAYLMRGGVRRSHNVDYFTLLRDAHGAWKFVNGSYTTKPVQAQ
jgi:ketosteroid isomerase-like protein